MPVPPSSPTPTPFASAAVPPPAESGVQRRSSQLALALLLVVFLGILVYRGYGARLGTRPTDLVVARYDLNRADRSELEQIPGVGPKLAQAIQDHRREKGPYRSIEDLRGVKGIGPATLDKVRPYVRVESDSRPGSIVSSPDLDPPLPARKRSPELVSETNESKPAAPPVHSGTRKLQQGDPPINVNTATVEELLRLPSVGPVTAQNIVNARSERPFQTISDLDRVKGIGPKTIEKLRPYVVVD